MRYILRADASQSIGAGHVMRSSAIAEELIARGETVIFIGKITDLPWVEERILSLKFSNIYPRSSDFESNPKSDVLILDSYEIHIDDAFITFEKWKRVVVIVDEVTPSYRCTLRIHPGLDSNWIGDSDIPILAGPHYVPFRSSLSKKITRTLGDSGKLKILVVAGGSDPHNLVIEIAKILAQLTEPFEAYLFSKSSSAVGLDSRFLPFEIGSMLDEITSDVDLVFTTSSTSSLEFIAQGLCVGAACAVDNQQQYYDSFGQLGIAAQIGLRTPSFGWKLNVEIIHKLILHPEFRESFTKRAAGLIDFQGARRIVDAIADL